MSSPPPESPRSSPPPDKPTRSSKGPSGGDDKPRSPLAGPWLIVILILGILLIWMWRSSPTNTGSTVKYSFFRAQLAEGNVKEVRIYGDILTGEWKTVPPSPNPKDGQLKPRFNTVLLPGYVTDDGLYPLMDKQGIVVDVEKTSIGAGTQMIFWLGIPLLMFVVFWFLIRRASDPMGGGMMGGFTRSSAKRFEPNDERTTFDDVAAMEQAKRELQEVVEFLKNPAKFQRLGAQIPKGVLLMGPPGTGKTLLARATAGEAGVPFFSINGSEFIQMFVGVGASRVRDLFQNAKQASPCIVFIDEIDAVGRQRGAGMGGGNDEREQTLNSLLVEMDGFDGHEGVIIIAATNRPDVLDTALLRPGRFDRQVVIDLPDLEGRDAILQVHAKKIKLSETVDLTKLARATAGFSGADLANLLNEGALIAARRRKKMVEPIDLDDAREKISFGRERRRAMDEEDRKIIAYHESGHAIVQAVVDDGLLPIHKVTIIPRGQSLGSTMFTPKKDILNHSKRRLLNQVCCAMGGRAAEELELGDVTSGAAGDIRMASNLARNMVCDWGMSELGMLSLGDKQDQVFLGKELTRSQNYSEETARKVDAAIKDIIDVQYQRAVGIITERRTALDKIAAALLEYETIEGKHVHEILELGEIRSPITKDVPPEDPDEEAGEEQSKKESAKEDDVGGIEPGSEPAGVPA